MLPIYTGYKTPMPMWSVYLIHWNNWILLACFYVHQFHPVQLDLVSSLVSKWSVEESHLLFKNVQFMSVQLFSHVRLFATPWTAARQASLSIINSWSLLKVMSIKSVMPSNNLILCHPLLLLSSIFPSIRVFSNGSVLHIRWPKYLSFSFSISPSNDYSGLISFRID